MIMNLYAIKDELNGFTPPIPFLSEDLAKRYLKDQVRENPTLKNTPEDFAIYRVGAYDTDTAKLQQGNEPELVERAKSYVS